MSWEGLSPTVKRRGCRQINMDYPQLRASTTRRTRRTGGWQALRIRNSTRGVTVYCYEHDDARIQEAIILAMGWIR